MNYLDITEIITEWTLEFKNTAREKYKTKAKQVHPDKNNQVNSKIMVLVNKAIEIFQDERKTNKYIQAIKTYNKIFFNKQSYGKAA